MTHSVHINIAQIWFFVKYNNYSTVVIEPPQQNEKKNKHST